MREIRSLRLVALLFPALAWGQSAEVNLSQFAHGLPNINVTSTGSTTTRTVQDRFADILNVKDYGAKLNTISTTACAITSGANTLTCSSATFTAADVGKAIAVTGAGAAGATLTSTIQTFNSATSVTLANNASSTTSTIYAQGVPSEAAFGSAYIPGDTVTLAGGTFTTATVLNVRSTRLVSATVNNAGSGGLNGQCTLTGTTGSPANAHFQITATISGGAISALGVIGSPGYYTTNPTSLTGEPVTSNCGLTGATLNLTIGVNVMGITTPGVYSVAPSSPVSQGSTSGSGSGATFNMVFQTTGQATYGSDDTAAWNAVIARSNSIFSTSAQRPCISMPAGVTWISSTLTLLSGPGCILGAGGDYKSIIFVSPALTGDVFSWSDAWSSGDYPFNGSTVPLSTQKVGPTVIGVSLIGDRNNAGDVTAFHFYDRADYIYFDQVDATDLRGQLIKTGDQKNTTQSFIRESIFANVRCFLCGDTGKAAIEFYASGTGTGGTPVDLDNINVYASYGDGIYIHSDATGSSLRGYHFKHLRIEGLENNSAGISAHLLHIGNSAQLGTVNQIQILDAQILSPYFGNYGIFIDGSAANAPFDIHFQGEFGGGTAEGGGINLNACRECYFVIENMISTQPNITAASSTTVQSPIVIDGGGMEGTYTTSIDATSAPFIFSPLRTTLTNFVAGVNKINANTGAFSLRCAANNSTSCGNPIGLNAIDLQTGAIGNAGQVCSGAAAMCLGQQNNNGSSNGTAVGFNHSMTGAFTTNLGEQAQDRGHYGGLCTANGKFSAQGDAQTCFAMLRGTGASASAFRLTEDGGAAGAANCINIPNNTYAAVTINVGAFDHTTTSKSASWNELTGLLTRQASAATTALNIASSTPSASQSNGTLTGMALSITADTSNGCINVSFTPPTGNTDTWNVVAAVQSIETQ